MFLIILMFIIMIIIYNSNTVENFGKGKGHRCNGVKKYEEGKDECNWPWNCNCTITHTSNGYSEYSGCKCK